MLNDQSRGHVFRGPLLFAMAVATATVGPAPGALAQSPPSLNQIEQSDPAVNLTMEQRHVIKEIIIKEMKIEPQKQAENMPSNVGATVPTGIPLQPVPVEVTAKIPQLKAHSFVVKDNKVLVVDPKSNKIAALID